MKIDPNLDVGIDKHIYTMLPKQLSGVDYLPNLPTKYVRAVSGNENSYLLIGCIRDLSPDRPADEPIYGLG